MSFLPLASVYFKSNHLFHLPWVYTHWPATKKLTLFFHLLNKARNDYITRPPLDFWYWKSSYSSGKLSENHSFTSRLLFCLNHLCHPSFLVVILNQEIKFGQACREWREATTEQRTYIDFNNAFWHMTSTWGMHKPCPFWMHGGVEFLRQYYRLVANHLI